jgi:hypothetical protein
LTIEDADVGGNAAINLGDADVAHLQRRIALGLVDEELDRRIGERGVEDAVDVGEVSAAGGASQDRHRGRW